MTTTTETQLPYFVGDRWTQEERALERMTDDEADLADFLAEKENAGLRRFPGLTLDTVVVKCGRCGKWLSEHGGEGLPPPVAGPLRDGRSGCRGCVRSTMTVA
jgi:hypothetical protein